MPQFIQTTGVTERNRHLHLNNINLSNYLAYQFNQLIMDEPSSFIYDAEVKKVLVPDLYNLHPQYSIIIAQQINWLLEFDMLYNDRDDYLCIYLNKFKHETFVKNDVLILKKIFYNLDLHDYFGKISSDFLKNKINELLSN